MSLHLSQGVKNKRIRFVKTKFGEWRYENILADYLELSIKNDEQNMLLGPYALLE